MAMSWRVSLVKHTRWILEHWVMLFVVIFGIFNVLPFLAPVAMKLGWTPVGNAIYTLYFPFCHQMAQRSFFLFGEQSMYSVYELPIQLTENIGQNTLALKQFNGNNALGWKVAWSDRMVFMYGAMWAAAGVFALVNKRRTVRALPIWALVLLWLPMLIDGGTHMISDYMPGGMFNSFRYHNAWLQQLTGNIFPAAFYVGNKLGSFNSWMRLISGLGFGVGLIGFAFPLIEQDMRWNARLLQEKIDRYHQRQRDTSAINAN